MTEPAHAPDVLRGNRVCLEPLGIDHVDALVAAATESRASYGFTAVPQDVASTIAYVEAALADRRRGWALPFAINDLTHDRIVGSTRFLDLDYWNRSSAPPVAEEPAIPSVAEIGSTWLAASAQRTGVNTEAKLLMLTHAFETWNVHRITFKTDVRNHQSRRAIERIGAIFEGVRRAHVQAIDGTIRDTAYYSIVADEWARVKRALDALRARR
jgi:N-acetyltransferase